MQEKENSSLEEAPFFFLSFFFWLSAFEDVIIK